jgi:isopenicillin N synthase-like dioxygenase
MSTLTSTIGSSVQLPIVDISPLLQHHASSDIFSAVDELIGRACADCGFFYIVGHGIPADLQNQLQSASSEFFSLDATLKKKVAVTLSGKAWRGTMERALIV